MRLSVWKHLPTLLLCTIAAAVTGEGFPRAGAQAELATFFHNVSGTATLVSSNSIRVDNFNYDGGGPAVYFYLGANDTQQGFVQGIPIGGLLTGTAYTNATVTVSLPGGQTLEGYHALSVWCVDFAANFGSGTFQPVVQRIERDAGATSLSVSGAVGQQYQLQATTNLTDWTDLDLITNTNGTVNFTDPEALPARVYRVEVK